jgi:nitrite reductase/ring-hydroxylating ferredoxin subunit
MAKHVVAVVGEIPPGGQKAVKAGGRPIVVYNLEGEYFALLDKCPHQGAPLSKGVRTGLAGHDGPGRPCMRRQGEIVMCPNHGWEFDIRTGQSWFDPTNTKVKTYFSEVASGTEVVEGPYKAETFEVSVDENYIVVTV